MEPEPGRVRLLMVALSVGVFLAALDQTVVATALPTIVAELGGLRLLPWVGAAYLLAATVSMPVAGKLSDTYGRKRVLLVALGLFIAGSALAGAARSMGELVAFRAVQGVGGGALGAAAFAVVADLAGPTRRGRYLSYLGAVFGVASVVGPPVGGLFAEGPSWRWIFYLNVVLGAGIMAAIGSLLTLPGPVLRVAIDYAGIVLIGGAVTCLVLVAGLAQVAYPWRSPVILGLVAGGVLLAVCFVLVERRVPEPVIPLRLFRIRALSASSAVGFLTGLALFGAITYLPLFFQVIADAGATEAGMLLIPFMAAVVLSSITAGRMVDRTGRHWPFPVAGTAIAAVAMSLLSTMDTGTSVWLAEVYLVAFGLGIGMVMQVIVLAAQASAPRDSIGTATSTVLFARSVGSLLGVTVLGAVFNWRLAGQLADRLPPGVPDINDLSPELVRDLPGAARAAVTTGFADAFAMVFLVSVPFLIAAFLSALLLRPAPTRPVLARTEEAAGPASP